MLKRKEEKTHQSCDPRMNPKLVENPRTIFFHLQEEPQKGPKSNPPGLQMGLWNSDMAKTPTFASWGAFFLRFWMERIQNHVAKLDKATERRERGWVEGYQKMGRDSGGSGGERWDESLVAVVADRRKEGRAPWRRKEGGASGCERKESIPLFPPPCESW